MARALTLLSPSPTLFLFERVEVFDFLFSLFAYFVLHLLPYFFGSFFTGFFGFLFQPFSASFLA